MSHTLEADVVIGGGGVAGLATAAAIEQLGYSVVVIEPGLNDERRLAGEVFHPPGVAGLAELGLLPALQEGPAETLDGFSVWLDRQCVRLPYSAVKAHRTAGLCLQHGLIRERLVRAVEALPNISIKRQARVMGIDQSDPSHVVVEVANGAAATTSYRCRMLVAADGASSRLARLAGIAVRSRRISTIMAYRLSTANLPEAGFGHVFLGARSPILLYPIGCGEARILFDIPYQAGCRASVADCTAMAQALPAALRREVEHAIATQPRMSMLAQAVTAEHPVRGRVVLVGDAGGSCHPLTATGMAMCVSDALMLQGALRQRADDVPAALLGLYQRRRRWPQATRLLLAEALRDAFCGARSDLRVLRGGIVSHLERSAAGRAATLALLSTADGRPLALLRQLMAVMLRGYLMHLRDPLPADRNVGAIRVAGLLAANLLRHIRQMLRGPPEAAHGPVAPAGGAPARLDGGGAARAAPTVQH